MVAVEHDKRRMEVSILIALVFWAFMIVFMALIKITGPAVPKDSMNPVYIELAPPEKMPEPPRPERVGGSPSSASAPVASAERSAPGNAPRPEPAAAQRSTAQNAPSQASSPELRPDPDAAPLPSRSRSPSAFQGGADPFSRLNEDSLKSENLPAPVDDSTAPAARANTTDGRRTAAAGGLPQNDDFSRSLSETEQKLGTAGGSGQAGGVPGGTGSSTSGGTTGGTSPSQGRTGTVPGGGDLAGNFDFGDGIVRELWSSRKIRVPDRLLAGQPDTISARVSFIIEPGGTVILNTIRFEPPLPQGLEEFLRAFFGSWNFSPADSDGQVRFQYSIKVR